MTEGKGAGSTPFFVGTVEPLVRHNRLRYEHTTRFVGKLSGDVLDCGEPNLLKEMLEKANGIRITNTTGDLDVTPPAGSYDAVLAFEVIEHLMNPLSFLTNVRNVLKPNGSLFLSTPINKPKFLWRSDHFHEFDEYRLKVLIDRAGFRVVRKEIRRFYRLNGIRPLIRALAKSGTVFLELTPEKAS